jgi:hypothetical protein
MGVNHFALLKINHTYFISPLHSQSPAFLAGAEQMKYLM